MKLILVLFNKFKFKFYFLFLVTCLLVNCSFNFWNFKRYSVVAPNNLEATGEEVEGKDCKFTLYQYPYYFFVANWYWNSLAEATRDAIQQSPGATGLKDVEVNTKNYILFTCIAVTVTPVKEI